MPNYEKYENVKLYITHSKLYQCGDILYQRLDRFTF